MSRDNSAISLLTGLVLGGLIGAGIGMVMAPQSGEETRKQLKDKGDDALKQAKVNIDKFKKENVDPLINKVQDAVTNKTAPTTAAKPKAKK